MVRDAHYDARRELGVSFVSLVVGGDDATLGKAMLRKAGSYRSYVRVAGRTWKDALTGGIS